VCTLIGGEQSRNDMLLQLGKLPRWILPQNKGLRPTNNPNSKPRFGQTEQAVPKAELRQTQTHQRIARDSRRERHALARADVQRAVAVDRSGGGRALEVAHADGAHVPQTPRGAFESRHTDAWPSGKI
jgi:hypothetical protein